LIKIILYLISYILYLLIGGTVRGLTLTLEESKLYPYDSS
jgi:hypothetical protein